MAEPRIPLQDGVVAVVTMDQRGSRGLGDAVRRHASHLNERYREVLVRRFVRTAGDEMQAAATDVGWLVDFLLEESREGDWWVGVGIGRFEQPLRRTARDSTGEAFYAARKAVERAKRTAWGFALIGRDVEPVEDCVALTSFVVRRRTERQQEAVDRLRQFGQAKEAAAKIGITASSMSERLRGAGLDEEQAGRRLADHLLNTAAAAT